MAGTKAKNKKSASGEIGSSGVNRAGGTVNDEFLRMLQGDKALAMYREMEANSPVIAAALLFIRQHLKQTPFTVEPADGDKSRAGKKAAEFVRKALDDMSTSFAEVLGDILSFLTYGWSYHELVYKIRPDGLWGWRKWAPRSQFTRMRWEFADDDGAVSAMWQLDPSVNKGLVRIPIERALLFRSESANGSPEGRSPLRAAFVPYYHSKKFQELLGIGVERDLAGYPVYSVPEGLLSDPTKKAELEKQVRGIRRAELEGLLKPSARASKEAGGHPLYELELLASGGSRQFDLKAILARYDMLQALPLLADFMLLGQNNVGSQSLGETKKEMFQTAVGGWRAAITEPINRYAIPRLYVKNGWERVEPCRVVFGDVRKADLEGWARLLDSIVSAGGFLDSDLQKFLHEQAGWPAPMVDVKPGVPTDTNADPTQDPAKSNSAGDGEDKKDGGAGGGDTATGNDDAIDDEA